MMTTLSTSTNITNHKNKELMDENIKWHQDDKTTFMSGSKDDDIHTAPTNNIKNTLVRTEEPKDNDVLCGRGGQVNTHPGNVYYRQIVESKKAVYVTARKKLEKRMISQEIVNRIKSREGRFLIKNFNGLWEVLSEAKALDKTSQALREDAPKIREKLKSTMDERGINVLLNNSVRPPVKPIVSNPPTQSQSLVHSLSPQSSTYEHPVRQSGMSSYAYNLTFTDPCGIFSTNHLNFFDRICGAPTPTQEVFQEDEYAVGESSDVSWEDDDISLESQDYCIPKRMPLKNEQHIGRGSGNSSIWSIFSRDSSGWYFEESRNSELEELSNKRDSMSFLVDSERTAAPPTDDENEISARKDTSQYEAMDIPSISEGPLGSISMSEEEMEVLREGLLHDKSLTNIFDASLDSLRNFFYRKEELHNDSQFSIMSISRDEHPIDDLVLEATSFNSN